MNKKLLFLIFIIMLGINSCSLSGSFDTRVEQNDYPVYLIEENPTQGQLIFYDPILNVNTPILLGWEVGAFSLNKNNRLAFSSSQDGKNKIYTLDYPFNENIPKEIYSDTFAEIIPLSWSPDGQYLLLDSTQENGGKLLIWNGKNISTIYDYQELVSEFAWNLNGQFAFTDFYTFFSLDDGDPSEIFIWDGKTMINASQNPSGVDRSPAWSQDGKLAFLSERNGENDIVIWDGVSKNNGKPDLTTFVNIAPDLTHYFSDPVWTNSGSLAFSGGNKTDLYAQIYEWDGQTAKNISNNPSLHNGGQTWRNDGYWSFITFFSRVQTLYVRNSVNQTVLETNGQYTPAWSRSGLLIFCAPEYPKWILSMWNGKDVIEIAYSSFISAMWNNGGYVICSNG